MRKVVITGMGIVSPVGTGIEYAWKNVVAGKSGVRKIDSFEVECESLESIHNHSAWAYQQEG